MRKQNISMKIKPITHSDKRQNERRLEARLCLAAFLSIADKLESRLAKFKPRLRKRVLKALFYLYAP